jgi:hypothetical protein
VRSSESSDYDYVAGNHLVENEQKEKSELCASHCYDGANQASFFSSLRDYFIFILKSQKPTHKRLEEFSISRFESRINV